MKKIRFLLAVMLVLAGVCACMLTPYALIFPTIASGHSIEDHYFGNYAASTWSPDGNLLAFVASDEYSVGYIYVIDEAGNGLRKIVDQPGYLIQDMAWSEDGQQIYYCDYEECFAVEIDSQQRESIPQEYLDTNSVTSGQSSSGLVAKTDQSCTSDRWALCVFDSQGELKFDIGKHDLVIADLGDYRWMFWLGEYWWLGGLILIIGGVALLVHFANQDVQSM